MVDKIWYNMEELIGGSEERGINRNILECKLEIMMQVVVFRMRINRNILECKFLIFINILYHNQLVLIETYWNVNKILEIVISSPFWY